MRARKTIVKVSIPVIILAAGLAGMQIMLLSKEPPKKEARPNPGALVETMSIKLEERPVTVWATGTVQPRMTADIVPQVSGRVTNVTAGFVVGGFFKNGDLLFEIEAIDYELAAEKSRAAVAKAEFELAQIESRARVAHLEWERIPLLEKDRPNPLVLYEPQLKDAQAALASALADLKQRLLDIRRTKVYAPFNCRIRSESIDPGQHVTAGKSVAVACGTDTAEIVVPVSFTELRWLSVPRKRGEKSEGSPATVRMDVEGQTFTWHGRVDRSLGEVDPKGRMARLVADVPDPYGIRLTSQGKTPDLAEGLFVEVVIEGKTIENIACMPAGALRQNSTVWVMNDKNRLEFRDVELVRRERQMVLVHGLEDGEKLILTYLPGAAPGMKLRPMEGE
jgi:RND family efflux transporter MFP subunit